jgi:hypothetical protein
VALFAPGVDGGGRAQPPAYLRLKTARPIVTVDLHSAAIMPLSSSDTRCTEETMKTLLVAAFAAALAVAAPAGAQDAKQDFMLMNKTGYELKALYVSPSKSDDWEDDVLGQDTLSDGQAVNVHFSPKTKTCKWDLKVTYSDDDSSAVWHDIDLCKVEKITIKYNRKSDQTSASFD